MHPESSIPWPKRRAVLILLALLAVIVAYAPAWPGSFVWDDDVNIVQNEHLRTADGWRRIWLSRESIEYYPLYYSSLKLQRQIFGERPVGYLIINLLLHGASALLLRRILLRLSIPGADLAAVLFVLHPVGAHTVGWITQHKTVLSTFLYGWSVLAYLRGKRFSALGLFVAGLLTKPTMIFLPFFLFALDQVQAPGTVARSLVRLGPWFVIAAVLGCIRLYWEPPPELVATADRVGSGWLRAAVAGCSLWFSAWKILVPIDLMMIYPRWSIAGWTPWFLAPLFMAAGVLILLARYRAKAPGVFLGVWFFVLAMLPVSGIFDNTFFAFSHVANHWMYPALPGIIALVAFGLTRFPSRAIRRWMVAVIVVGYAFLTAHESRRFHDPMTYYERGIRENPDNVIAHFNLANLLVERGRHGDALRHYQEANRIHPDFWASRLGAGKALMAQGDYKEAFDQIAVAFAVAPDHPEIRFHLGVLFGKAGRHEEAVTHLLASLELNPLDPAAWNNLGAAYYHLGDVEAAVRAVEQAVRLNPDYPAAHDNLERLRKRLREE